MTGFGLAAIKPEGMCFSYDPDGIEPWYGHGKEFNKYFKDKYESIWYYKPFIRILRKITMRAWHHALYINAKNQTNKKEPNA